MNISGIEEASGAEPQPRKRAPRRAQAIKELQAFNKGYEAGRESAGGSGVFMLLAGAVSGAVLIGIASSLWRAFH